MLVICSKFFELGIGIPEENYPASLCEVGILPTWNEQQMERSLYRKDMRKVLLLVIVSIALFSSPAIASWVRVKTSATNDIYSVDDASIEGRDRFRYFWSNVVFGKPQPVAGKLASSAAFYLSVDCQKKLFRLRFTRFLDDNNKTIQDYNYGESANLAAPVPGSSEEASMKFVCSRR
jgi:hypothetical protein